MKINGELLKVLSRKYEPSTMVQLTFKRYDLNFKTDAEGNPILLFMGKLNEKGQIKGERFARRLVKDAEGKVVKDHWDNKGPATG